MLLSGPGRTEAPAGPQAQAGTTVGADSVTNPVPGAPLTLDIGASTDPDGDPLRFSWWQYQEPGTYRGTVAISDAHRGIASMRVPDAANTGDTIHLIGQVTDSGTPPLTRYTRVIVTVGSARAPATTPSANPASRR